MEAPTILDHVKLLVENVAVEIKGLRDDHQEWKEEYKKELLLNREEHVRIFQTLEKYGNWMSTQNGKCQGKAQAGTKWDRAVNVLIGLAAAAGAWAVIWWGQ